VEEIIAVMRAAGEDADGARLRALIVILWRAGLRIGEALIGPEAVPTHASRSGAAGVDRGYSGLSTRGLVKLTCRLELCHREERPLVEP
jgi:hypothetical protein